MGIRDYLNDPKGRRSIRQAIRGAFARERGTAGHVLVVDPDPLSRETLVRILRRANYHAVGAADDAEAVGLCEQHPFDLMIKETRRPDRDKTEELKVLAVMSRDGLGQAPRPDAASNTLVRPFGSQQLLQAIERALQDV